MRDDVTLQLLPLVREYKPKVAKTLMVAKGGWERLLFFICSISFEITIIESYLELADWKQIKFKLRM